MRTNYVFIDYENVQPSAIASLDQEHFKILVFIGASQSKVTFDVASAVQRMGAKATYIKISGNGRNALDFHIAFYIGKLAVSEPDAFFHIVSSDTGFDPLIAHLKECKILACRSRQITEIPIVKAAVAKTPAERLDIVLAGLRHLGSSRPRTVKTLSTTINSKFQKTLSPSDIDKLIKALVEKEIVRIDGTKVSYSL